LFDALKKYREFKRIFYQLFQLAVERKPDLIICVDFSGFNHRFANAVKKYVRARAGTFLNWNPKIVQYVSPQVWASRPGRAYQLARDVDSLLSILPFERDWYAARVPQLRVEFVGQPIWRSRNPAPSLWNALTSASQQWSSTKLPGPLTSPAGWPSVSNTSRCRTCSRTRRFIRSLSSTPQQRMASLAPRWIC